MKEFLALLLCFGILIADAAAAQTGANCAQRDQVVAQLTKNHGETRQAVGLSAGQIIELYANNETGSWSIIATRATGLSCLVAAGRAFEATAMLPGTPA